MKYVAYFRPAKELTEAILIQNHVRISAIGLHSTLYFFQMNPNQEEALIEDLLGIKFSPFELKTLGFVDFDKNSFALRLSYPDELSKLHKEIDAVARKYAQPTSTNAEESYFRENYRPHITISESSSQFDRNSQVLIGRNFIVPEYFLAGKYAGNWEHVQRFGAG